MKIETEKKERAKLLQHVKRYYFINQKEKREDWEMSCWLGKEPTGRLFTIEYKDGADLDERFKKLADDMFDFLHTLKGEEIYKQELYKKEYDRDLKSLDDENIEETAEKVNCLKSDEKEK